MNLVDVHCHLESNHFKDKLDTIVDKASKAGIVKMITSSIVPEQWTFSKSISEKYKEVEFSLGIHPRYLNESLFTCIKELENAKEIQKVLTEIEEVLYQTKNRSSQDPLNYPIRLTNKLAHLNSLTGRGDYPPTQQAIQVKNDLTGKIDEELSKFNRIKEADLPEINRMIREKAVDAISIKKDTDSSS